jgi:hypothetical protein
LWKPGRRGPGSTNEKIKHQLNEWQGGVQEEGHGSGDEQAQAIFARTNSRWNKLGIDLLGQKNFTTSCFKFKIAKKRLLEKS